MRELIITILVFISFFGNAQKIPIAKKHRLLPLLEKYFSGL